MSLRSRILIIMLVVMALYSAVYYGVQHFVIKPGFDTLERDQAKKEITQCVDAIRREARYLDRLCRDWSESPEAAKCFQDKDYSINSSRLAKEPFKDGMLDMVCVLDLDGEVLWIKTLDLKGKVGDDVTPFLKGEQDKRKFVLKCRNTDDFVFGIVTTETDPMLISCRPVTGGGVLSSSRGILVMGRFLHKGLVDALSSQVRIDFDVWSADISRMPVDCQNALAGIENGNDHVISVRAAESMSAYALMTDVEGASALLMRANLPRFIGLTGKATMNTAQLAVLSSALLLLVVMIFALQELVIAPVEKLTKHVVKVSAGDELAARSGRKHNEIETLMKEFDFMVQQVKRHEKELVQAHKMIALGTLVSGVAHEINNPNGVITLNVVMIEKLSKSVFDVLDEYEEKNGAIDIGVRSYSEVRGELESLTSDVAKSAERIKVIVSDLTSFVREDATDLSETVEINSVVSETLGLASSTIAESTNNLSVSYGKDIPPLKGNSNRLQQVFINLISNACQAVTSLSDPVRVRTSFDASLNEVCVVIEDEGEGISEEDMLRVKDPFFTTRRDEGGTGLGLSICEGIISAHGGTMVFDSEPGKGTTVKVKIPVDRTALQGDTE